MQNNAYIYIVIAMSLNVVAMSLNMYSRKLGNDELKDAMTATTAQEAVERGVMLELSPYFSACQKEGGIVPGDRNNVTLAQAKAANQCLFDKAKKEKAASVLSFLP